MPRTSLIPSDWRARRNGQTAHIEVVSGGNDLMDRSYCICYEDDETGAIKWDSEEFDIADGDAAIKRAETRVGTLTFARRTRNKRLHGCGISYAYYD